MRRSGRAGDSGTTVRAEPPGRNQAGAPNSIAYPRAALKVGFTGRTQVHCNTLEGLWTGLRNFLRPFRGVHKKYLYQYVAMVEWSYNVKRVTTQFIRALLGIEAPPTRFPS